MKTRDKKERPHGFFWKNITTNEYCVVVIDSTRRERHPDDRRRWRTWAREWYATTITALRNAAREDGIVLPRNTRALCEQSPKDSY